MRLAWFSSWLVKCGLASYSWDLTHALAELGVESKVVRLARYSLLRSPRYYEWWAKRCPRDVDAIVVNHEYGVFDQCEANFYRSLHEAFTQFIGKKLPIVTVMHNTGNPSIDGIIANYSSKVVAHNQYGADLFKYPCEVIPMGCKPISEEEKKVMSDVAKCKERWGVSPETPTVGMFGFISPYKGVEDAITLINKIPEATLLLGGGWFIDVQTPYIQSLQRFALTYAPQRVRFLNYVESEDLPKFFGACDIILVAHKFVSESMTLTTALSYGKPVLARDMPPFREKERLNALITFTDLTDLVGKTKALLKEEELRQILSRGAMNYASQYSWTKVALKHKELYESLLKGEGQNSKQI